MSGIHTHVRLSFYNDYEKDSLGFGTGMVRLLEIVERTGSIRQACQEMGMAYSKSWKILKKTEEEFGVSLLERDGRRGSRLTEAARALLRDYHEVLTAARAAAETRYRELHPEE